MIAYADKKFKERRIRLAECCRICQFWGYNHKCLRHDMFTLDIMFCPKFVLWKPEGEKREL